MHARYVHFDGSPERMLLVLRMIWRSATGCDPTALIDLILSHDWERLDPHTRAGAGTGLPAQQAIPGIGITLAFATSEGHVLPPEPVSTFPLGQPPTAVKWIYLIDPHQDLIRLYFGEGAAFGALPLRP